MEIYPYICFSFIYRLGCNGDLNKDDINDGVLLSYYIRLTVCGVS